MTVLYQWRVGLLIVGSVTCTISLTFRAVKCKEKMVLDPHLLLLDVEVPSNCPTPIILVSAIPFGCVKDCIPLLGVEREEVV